MPSAKMLLFTKLATPKVPKKRSRAGEYYPLTISPVQYVNCFGTN